jgi:hypothetical protein
MRHGSNTAMNAVPVLKGNRNLPEALLKADSQPNFGFRNRLAHIQIGARACRRDR